MTHLFTLLPALGGFIALCLAMDRHREDLLGRTLSRSGVRLLRGLGWLLLTLAYAVAVRGAGWGIGSVAWTGHLSLAAGLVMLTLIVRDRRRVR